jgi:hypothetical protein
VHIDRLRILKNPTFSFELRGDLALVVMHGGIESRRCLFATTLYLSLFRDLDPDAVMFVTFDPITGRFALDRLRWSVRLWSYIYLDSVTLSDEFAVALGLGKSDGRRAVAQPLLRLA